MRRLSVICLRPFASMIASAPPPLGPHGLEDLLGDLAGDRVVVDAREQRRQSVGGTTRLCAMSSFVLVERAGELRPSPSWRRASAGRRGARPRPRSSRPARGSRSARRRRRRTGRSRATKRAALLRPAAPAAWPAPPRPARRRSRAAAGRVREVAVVVRLFLAAHRAGLVAVRVVEARLLHDLAAALDQLDLPLDLEVDRPLDEAEGVEVLDLGAGAELRLCPRGRTETLASQRNEPSCMLPSQMPR